jgi:hypothetical protein
VFLEIFSDIPVIQVALCLGKYNEEAIVFAGKLDDKLASTRLSEDIQMAKRKLEAILKFGSHTK